MTISYKKVKINRFILIGIIFYLFVSVILYQNAYLIFDFLIGNGDLVHMVGLFQILILFLPFTVFQMLLGNSVLLANGKTGVVIVSSSIALICTLIILSCNEYIENDLKLFALLILTPKIIELIIRIYSAVRMRLIF